MPTAFVANSTTPLWYTTRATGFAALVLLTASMALGLLSATGYRRPGWPRFAERKRPIPGANGAVEPHSGSLRPRSTSAIIHSKLSSTSVGRRKPFSASIVAKPWKMLRTVLIACTKFSGSMR